MNNYDQRDFSGYTVLESRQTTVTGKMSKKFMAGVFAWMFVALGVSTIFAVLFATNPSFMSLMYTQTTKGIGLNGFGMAISFAPLLFVLVMSFAFSRLSAPLLTLFFLLFATAMGMSLSTILFIYTSGSVIGCFATASAMFGIMAVMGYTTDKDLTSFGSILSMGLVGIIIAGMVNWFIHSAALEYMISIIGVAVFTGLTAYDVQKLKRIGAGLEYGENVSANDTKKLALMGALSLYLDFINLFLMLLRLFGNRRD
jgi:FtsH-binding integral membrane protein